MTAFPYTSRDFDNIKADMLRRAQRVLPEWQDRDASDFTSMLIDLWAFAADTMHYYIDRAAGESFLETAQRRESVQAFARLFDYVPARRTSSRGSISVRNNSGGEVTIPRYTEFNVRANDRSYVAYATSPVTIPNTETAAVPAAQGEPVLAEVLAANSNGQQSQRYTLRVPGAVVSSIEVFVLEDGANPVQYLRTARLSTALPGDRVFYIDILSDGSIDIVFGNFINGVVPPIGSRIIANYVTSEGESGNFPADSVVGFRSSAIPGISVVSSSSFSGGINDESITSMKNNIPSSIAAQYRAVTRADFVNLTTSIDGVSKAAVSYAPALVNGASATAGSVSIYAQPPRPDLISTTDTSQAVPQELRETIVSVVQPLAMLGVEVVAADTVQWTPFDVSITVNVNPRAVSVYVEREVRRAIENLYSFDSVFFGQLLVLAFLYRVCIDVPGVDYVSVTKFCKSGEDSVESEILIDPLELPKLSTLSLNMVGGIVSGDF